MPTRTDPMDFYKWLGSAATGDRYVYAVKYPTSFLGDVGAAALEAYNAGLVHLVQKRLDPEQDVSRYEYQAMKI